MLKIENLHAFYGKSHVLHGVSFDINSGEIVSLLGRNGSGRSTTAKSIMGLVECKGSIAWNGQAIVLICMTLKVETNSETLLRPWNRWAKIET